ncbi:MAG: 16S rRNA (adenine(1518)-N(6)/adenine(1519)-N(6))-dimethyltransferase RsmA [Micavibrio sp.]
MTDAFNPVEALPPLREIINEHGLRAEKALGQNFLLDLNLTRKIARAARSIKTNPAFEIGPGPGGLTRAILLEGAPKLVALEYDARAVAALDSLVLAADGRLYVEQADALRLSLPACAVRRGLKPPYNIIANLPYNIATPLLAGWLQDIHGDAGIYGELILMFQKEVAQRIVASPSTKAYGRLSVLTQWLCDAKIVFDVPASAFVPPPKVTSSIVRLVPRERNGEALAAFRVMEEMTAASFGQRRKMIRSSLKNYAPFLEACGLDDQARAEDIAVGDYARLALAVTKARREG